MNEFEASVKFWGSWLENQEREGCAAGYLKCPRCKRGGKMIKMVWNDTLKRGECPDCGWTCSNTTKYDDKRV